jgi:hypothetical protein
MKTECASDSETEYNGKPIYGVKIYYSSFTK